jgi:predicted lactoylglutathione lyase
MHQQIYVNLPVKQDLGFMYGRAFEDPDGHVWELAYMDPNAVPPQS